MDGQSGPRSYRRSVERGYQTRAPRGSDRAVLMRRAEPLRSHAHRRTRGNRHHDHRDRCVRASGRWPSRAPVAPSKSLATVRWCAVGDQLCRWNGRALVTLTPEEGVAVQRDYTGPNRPPWSKRGIAFRNPASVVAVHDRRGAIPAGGARHRRREDAHAHQSARRTAGRSGRSTRPSVHYRLTSFANASADRLGSSSASGRQRGWAGAARLTGRSRCWRCGRTGLVVSCSPPLRGAPRSRGGRSRASRATAAYRWCPNSRLVGVGDRTRAAA